MLSYALQLARPCSYDSIRTNNRWLAPLCIFVIWISANIKAPTFTRQIDSQPLASIAESNRAPEPLHLWSMTQRWLKLWASKEYPFWNVFHTDPIERCVWWWKVPPKSLRSPALFVCKILILKNAVGWRNIWFVPSIALIEKVIPPHWVIDGPWPCGSFVKNLLDATSVVVWGNFAASNICTTWRDRLRHAQSRAGKQPFLNLRR